MSEDTFSQALLALHYECADPATRADLGGNRAVARVRRWCCELSDRQHGEPVVPLRAGVRR
jgi:hypothetical protein